MASGTLPARSPREKVHSPSWIDEWTRDLGWNSLYEPFAGDAAISRYFKRLGKRIVCSDQLSCHAVWGAALIENNDQLVSPDRLQAWSRLIKDPAVATRFSPWANQYFTPEEAIWLGVWHAHLENTTLDPALKALGQVAVGLTMRYWLSFDRAEQPHKPMSPGVAFQHYLQTVNTWVCNNGQANQALHGDAHALVTGVEADLMVCAPPVAEGFSGTPDAVRLFEGWMRGDSGAVTLGSASGSGAPTLGTPLGDPLTYARALRRFLEGARHIPLWVIAFNDRFPVEESALFALVQEFRPIVRHASMKILSRESGPMAVERLFIARATPQ